MTAGRQWGRRKQRVIRTALPLVLTLPLVAAVFMYADQPASARPTVGVTDHVELGDRSSERGHDVRTRGASKRVAGSIRQGNVTETYKARSLASGGRIEIDLDVREHQPLTLQIQEVRPNDEWGQRFGFEVYVDGTLAYVRDNRTQDAGGGVLNSFFIDTGDPAVTRDGEVTVTIKGTSDADALIKDIWAYADIEQMVTEQDLRVPDRVVFVLGQDYRSDAFMRERLDYIKANYNATADVDLGFAVLDYFPVRTQQQMAQNYQRYLALSREYGLPFAIESTSDWEGTPRGAPDGKGGYFADLEYQQVLWSPQDQTGPDKDVFTNPDGEVQRLDELMGDAYEPQQGLSVPNVWGSTPWLTWHHPDLNAFYARKAQDSTEQVKPLVWDLQRQGEAWRVLPFSSTTESVYWAKQDNVGVWDINYTPYNGGVERRDIFADINPYTVAAAAEDGVTLDPTDGGWSAEEKEWLYYNQSHHQQFFTDLFYDGLPRERITAREGELSYPTDMLRHNIHSEVYSRKQSPYWSDIYPSSAQGVVERGRPGAQFISLDTVYSKGGFYHLQKMREFGRIANPNLENSVSTHAPDKTLLLRQAYVNGSRYTSPYNWQMAGADESTNWITPFLDDMNPWDVVHDGTPDDQITGQKSVTQSFTAGELRLANRVDVQLERVGSDAPLQLTVHEGGADGRIVTMRHLSAAEVPDDGWASFELPIEQLDRDQTYTIEISQVGGSRAAYAFPTAGGDLLHRVGLDMNRERDRSMVITWRRDAADAIENVRAELTSSDGRARQTLAAAERALDQNRSADAYRLAMRADAQRFPVLYQVDGVAELDPFPLTVETSSTVDVDVREFDRGDSLEFTVKGYESEPVSITASDFDDDVEVFVDGTDVDAEHDDDTLRFTVDVNTEVHSVEIR